LEEQEKLIAELKSNHTADSELWAKEKQELKDKCHQGNGVHDNFMKELKDHLGEDAEREDLTVKLAKVEEEKKGLMEQLASYKCPETVFPWTKPTIGTPVEVPTTKPDTPTPEPESTDISMSAWNASTGISM